MLWLQWREGGDLPLAATATFVSALSIKRLQEVEDAAKKERPSAHVVGPALIKRENPIS